MWCNMVLVMPTPDKNISYTGQSTWRRTWMNSQFPISMRHVNQTLPVKLSKHLLLLYSTSWSVKPMVALHISTSHRRTEFAQYTWPRARLLSLPRWQLTHTQYTFDSLELFSSKKGKSLKLPVVQSRNGLLRKRSLPWSHANCCRYWHLF